MVDYVVSVASPGTIRHEIGILVSVEKDHVVFQYKKPRYYKSIRIEVPFSNLMFLKERKGRSEIIFRCAPYLISDNSKIRDAQQIAPGIFKGTNKLKDTVYFNKNLANVYTTHARMKKAEKVKVVKSKGEKVTKATW